jgi:hypothetical protein
MEVVPLRLLIAFGAPFLIPLVLVFIGRINLSLVHSKPSPSSIPLVAARWIDIIRRKSPSASYLILRGYNEASRNHF